MPVSSMACQYQWMLSYDQQSETANDGPIYSDLITTTDEQKAQMQKNTARARDLSLAKTQRIEK